MGIPQMEKLTGQAFIEDMTEAELDRARRVESVLPALAAQAAEVDAQAGSNVGCEDFQNATRAGAEIEHVLG